MIFAMDVLRMLFAALVVAGLVALGAAAFDPAPLRDPESAVRDALRRQTSAEALARHIEGALERGRANDAAMYADIARFVGFSLRPEIEARLARELSETRSLAGDATSLAEGNVNHARALAGAVAADLTVIGDTRDIAAEGAKLVAGAPYDELVLGLSVVGAALSAVALADGGTASPVKGGLSVLKVARRTSHLTTELSRTLEPLVRAAVDPPQLSTVLRATRLSDTAATRAAMEAYSGQVRMAALYPLLSKVERLRAAAGDGEAVRLLRYVRTGADLDEVTAMSQALGSKTRGVMEITGKTSVKAFKRRFDALALVLGNIPSFLAWLGSFLALIWSRRVMRLLPILGG